MSVKASWGEAASIEEQAQRKLQDEIRRDRLHGRGTDRIPLDLDVAARELSDERRALRSSRPRNRRWRSLARLDEEIDRLTQQHADAGAHLQAAGQALADAPDHDARTLAAWIAAGEKGERPAATVYERQRDRDAARIDVDARALELDRALARRLTHIEKNRKKMLADARKDVDESCRRLRETIAELPALRDDLAAARQTLLWVAAYPDQDEGWGHLSAVALGLRQPVEKTLGTRAQIQYGAIREALEEDAAALAGSFSREQKERLGIAEPPTPLDRAMWDDEPDHVAWKKAEFERARRLAEWHDPDKVAAEIRDQRP